MADEWEDVGVGPSEWEDVAAGPPPLANNWNLNDSVKNFAAGAVEGNTGLLGLALDMAPAAMGGFPDLSFTRSRQIKELTDSVLPAEDEKYRYARTIGNFAGPNIVGGLVGKGAKLAATKAAPGVVDWLSALVSPRSGVQTITGALGAQSAEDLTGDDKIAPIIGAIFGSGSASVADDGVRMLRDVFFKATPEQIKGSAALAFKNQTGLTDSDMVAALASRPADDLGQMMTTAELTKNAGAAQLEKTLSTTDDAARLYNDRQIARENIRNEILNKATLSPGVNNEGLGTSLIEKAKTTQKGMADDATELWKTFPRREQINVGAEQSNLRVLLGKRQAGLPVDKQVDNLVQQFLAVDGKGRPLHTSGALQDIRSDALDLLRNKPNLTGYESRLLSELQGSIDESMKRGLSTGDYGIWQAGRKATEETKSIFGRGTAGGVLTGPEARPATVLDSALKGDKRSVQQLREAISYDPALVEDVKRYVIDSIPRDAKGNLTPNKMKNFLSANEGGLKELLGNTHYSNMSRILDDLQSESRVIDQAFRSSKGNSVTAQRGTVAGAISDLTMDAVMPGTGQLAKLGAFVRQSVGIYNEQQIKELLFKASLDPEFALELAKAPTEVRIRNVVDGLKKIAQGGIGASGKAAVLELTRSKLLENDKENNPILEPSPGQERSPSELPRPLSSPEQRYKLDEGLGAESVPSSKDTPLTSLFQPSSSRSAVSELFPSNIKEIEQEIDADPYYSALYETESGRNPKAKNPKSSAAGGFQFISATAKSLGVKDPYDLKESFSAVQQLTDQHKERFGDDPRLLYAAHFLGSPLLKKVMDGKKLTEREQDLVEEFKSKAYPRFAKIYEAKAV